MSFNGDQPSLKRTKYTPLSADPANPEEGDVHYSDGTARPEGLWSFDGTNWVRISSTQGGINYITNPDAEGGTEDWATYADVAGAKPVDGTGGAPTTTLTRNTTAPLRGTGDFVLTKDAANRQGEGASFDLTIDPVDQSRVLEISLDYSASSAFAFGTALDPAADPSDVVIYVFDVTNAVLIQPVPFNLDGSGRFSSSFQAAPDSTSYRLIAHVATTNASAWTFNFDNVRLGPQTLDIGQTTVAARAERTSPQSITTATWTTVIADTEDYDLGGAYDSSTGIFTVPEAGKYEVKTILIFADNTTGTRNIGVLANSIDRQQLTVQDGVSTANIIGGSYIQQMEVGDTLEVQVFQSSGGNLNIVGDVRTNFVSFIKILPSSDIAETRTVAAKAETDTAQSIPNITTTIINFEDVVYDTHDKITIGASWEYDVPSSGKYKVHAQVTSTTGGGWAAGEQYNLAIHIDGSEGARALNVQTATHTEIVRTAIESDFNLEAGQTIDIRLFQSSGAALTLNANAADTYVVIEKLEGPAVVSANEPIIARYFKTAAQSVGNGALEVLDFETKVIDTHGAVTTGASWVFTCPAAGKYEVRANVHSAAGGGWAAGEQWNLQLEVDATTFERDLTVATTTHAQIVSGNIEGIVECEAGQELRCRIFQDSGASLNTLDGQGDINITIKRIG